MGMIESLPPTWYLNPPIDFEHKQYVLFAYLQKVDESFLRKKVSPFLLQMEDMEKELLRFQRVLADMQSAFDRQRYLWFANPKLEGEKDELVEIIREIVDYSTPQICSRIETGRQILKRHRQLLWS